jgi:hypothetical protein
VVDAAGSCWVVGFSTADHTNIGLVCATFLALSPLAAGSCSPQRALLRQVCR